MSLEFYGKTDIPHVKQPAGSELCFAAMVSAVTGSTIEEANDALIDADLLNEDGTTSPPMGAERLHLAGKAVTIEPIVTPFDENPGDSAQVLSKIQDSLTLGRPTALLFKKDVALPDHHWVLFSSYAADGDEIISLRMMDSLRDNTISVTPRRVETMIDRSIDHLGVFACSFSIEAPQAQAA